MSTHDVPGFNDDNDDELAMGCWAEHGDGSMIFVESTEGSRVIYSIFDMSKSPPIEYRDAMPEASFKKTFSWDAQKSNSDKWTWHDKTPFPWDRVIKNGAADGGRFASAHDVLNAAERVAQSLKLRGAAISDAIKDRVDQTYPAKVDVIMDKVKRALGELLK